MDGDVIIGFMDESSPQTTANTQRLWSFGKPTIYKNTDKIKANAFGCYMLNGTSVIDFKDHSKKEDVGEFLITIREKNPFVFAGPNLTPHADPILTPYLS